MRWLGNVIQTRTYWKLLREIEVKLASGSDVPSACRGVGISDATYYNLGLRRETTG